MPQDNKQPVKYIDPFAIQQGTPPPVSPTRSGYVDPFAGQAVTPQESTQSNYVDPFETVTEKATKAASNLARPVLSSIAPVLDVLGRGQYASARFFDSTADESKTFMDAVSDAWSELLPSSWVAPGQQKKLSFSDVIKTRAKDFGQTNPIMTEVLGFVGDIALDPTSYLGVGMGKEGVQLGGKSLTKEGRAALKLAREGTTVRALVGNEGTIKAITSLDEELAKPVINAVKRVPGPRTTTDEELRNLLHKQIDANTMKSSDVPRLFEDMTKDLPEVGDAGISVDRSNPYHIKIVNRTKDGEINGILTVAHDGKGRIFDTEIATHPVTGQGFQSPLKKLGTAFLNEGFDVQQLVNADNSFTKEGARLMKLIVDNKVYPKPKVDQMIKIGGPDKAVVGELTDNLTQQGYFQAVKDRSNELNNLISGVTGTANDELAQQIAKSETLADLHRPTVTSTLSSSEIRDRVENRIQSIVELDPKLQDKFFAKPGIYIKAGLPFGKQRDILRIAGSDKAMEAVKSLNDYLRSAGKFGAALGKVEDTVGGIFNRNYNLPDEYVKLRDDLENYLGYTTDNAVRTTRKIFKDVDKEGREKIGTAMQWIDDQTRHLEQLRGGPLDQDEALQLIQNGLSRNKLEPKEQAIVAQLYQDYKDMATVEMRAGLLKNNLVNYSPRGYNVIADSDTMSTIVRGKYRDVGGPNPYLSSSQQRKFLTNAEAKAAGLDLELDAATLYANRTLMSQRALAIKQFKDSVTELFGTYVPNAKYGHTGVLPTGVIKESDLPRRVIDDMRMIGESVMPSNLSQSARDVLKVVDTIQGVFKRGATTFRPTFAMRQLGANTIQAAMVSGIKAFKAFDPRSAIDAATIFFNYGKKTTQTPEFLNNFISKYFKDSDAVLAQRAVMSHITGEERLADFASQYSLRNPFGEKISGTELIDEMRQNGVFREFDATGEGFTRKLESEISKDNTNWNAVKELGKFWKHAAIVEDYNRAMLYINGRRLGHSAPESAKIVNKALFDYSRGLSSIEKNVIKRLVPFYSYQRFAIPYVLKQVIKQPGTAGSMQKFLGTVEKLLTTGEPINQAEQDQLQGSFLWEQPRLFRGFDKDNKATFNILNNLTPLDVLGFMVYDKKGDLDLGRTAEKSVLGAITPFFKVPLEYKYNYNIFTQKTVEDATRLGDLSKIAQVIPQPVKELIGWEDRTSKVTGKTTTYINPFLAYYSMNFFPVVRDYIKPLDGVDGTLAGAGQAAMNIIMENLNPAKAQKLDLKAQSEFEMLKERKEIRELTKDLKSAMIKGSNNQAKKDLQSIQELFKSISANAELQKQFSIRGQGIGNTQAVQEGQEGTVPTQTPNIQQPFK